MRAWILRIHLYGGLLCAPYLIIFGFSSLHFNHHFFAPPSPVPVEWQQTLPVAPAKDNDAMAQSVRDSLGLIGWTIPWKMKRDASGDLHFDFERPGKSYTIYTNLKENKARVEERRKGFWHVFNSLHALHALPNSRFVTFWGVYTEICTGFVLFAAVSGVYLWVESQRERRVGIVTLLAAVLTSVAFMLVLVLRG